MSEPGQTRLVQKN